jgi:hypothetical protein
MKRTASDGLPPRAPRAARASRRRLGLAACAVLATTACGLQQSGLDGSVAVRAGLDGPGAGPVQTAPGDGSTGGTTGLGTTTGGSGTTGGTTGPIGTGSSGSTGAVGGSTGGSTGGGATGASTGVTASPGLKGQLVVSYVNVTGFDQLGKVVVVNTASTGDAAKQTAALAAWVNAHGGIAGRRLVPRVHDYNAQQASETNDNNLCQAITGTDKAFLAVLHGQIHYSARACYAAKKVLAFEGAAYGFGKDFYTAHAPSLWSPSYADYDQASRALVSTIKARKWLAGEKKVGVVLWDDKPYHDIADHTLVPLLKGLGVRVVQATVSNADIGAIENGIHAAAQTMVVQQVDHLLFLGSAPLQPFFVQQNQQNSQFVYALNSFDVPRYMAENFPNNMAGAIGIGFSPVDDVVDAQYRFPQPGLETQCRAIYQAAGIAVPGRYVPKVFNSKQAMSYCESTLLLKKVADTIPDALSAAAWTRAAQGLGRAFQAAQTFTTSYSADKHTGASGYREITYSTGCSCMTYTSGTKALP